MYDVRPAESWRTTEGAALAAEILARLGRRKSLQDLHLPLHDGRIDLRGLRAPEPTETDLVIGGRRVTELHGFVRFDGAVLADLDLSGARLPHFRFFHSVIRNCRFDRAICRDWRLWATDTADSSFAGAELSGALGSWYEGRGNSYERVRFVETNLRGAHAGPTTFTDCDFAHAVLVKNEFDGTSFIRCRFAGLLRGVIFYPTSFMAPQAGRARFEDVDFSDAQLRWCEFRGVDLDRVTFPNDADHLIITDPKCTLAKAIAAYHPTTPDEHGLAGLLGHKLKWVDEQRRTVLNRRDFVESAGEVASGALVKLLTRCMRECAASDT
jgi:uncharacterized protein YjbI with pentapeptide repeats